MSSVPSAYGWPFLVARGRHSGYRPLLVPAFLAERGEDDLLDHAGVQLTVVNGASVGDVVLASRSEQLSQQDAAWTGEPVTDEFGRPLELLYGFAVPAGGLDRLEDSDLDTARAHAFQTYQRFLVDESGFQREVSQPFVLRSTPATGHPVAEEAPAPSPGGRRGLVAAVVVLALAVSATVWSLLLRGSGGPVTGVDIAELATAAVDCSQPVTIRATIRSKKQATVSYHWESTLAADSQPVSIDFASAASRQVETTVRVRADSGAPVTFTQTLVVDDPNSAEDSRKFALTCR